MMLIFDDRVKQGVERRPEESVLHSPLPLCWPLGYQSHLLQVRRQVRRHERDGSDVGHPGTQWKGPVVEQEGPRPWGQLHRAHRHWGGGESALLAVCVISNFSSQFVIRSGIIVIIMSVSLLVLTLRHHLHRPYTRDSSRSARLLIVCPRLSMIIIIIIDNV